MTDPNTCRQGRAGAQGCWSATPPEKPGWYWVAGARSDGIPVVAFVGTESIEVPFGKQLLKNSAGLRFGPRIPGPQELAVLETWELHMRRLCAFMTGDDSPKFDLASLRRRQSPEPGDIAIACDLALARLRKEPT